ncbi:UDP-N-acetylmuramate--L-alanine ligase [Patescibacteria group bacterium]
MQLEKAQTIFFTGIGGIGMSGLAQLLQADGKTVLGSDLVESEVTALLQEKGIAVHTSQDGAGMQDADLLIYSAAVPEDHAERKKAKELKIPQMSYFEAVGEYMKEFKTTIAVSGTHGKTTTTAMIANLLVNAGLDPTVLVGSLMKESGSNAREGAKDFLLVEGCEHNEHMLNLHPNIIVLTNVDADHLDYYRDFDHIISAFQEYVDQLPEDGLLITNADDDGCAKLSYSGSTIRYGLSNEVEVSASNVATAGLNQAFIAHNEDYELQLPGEFNVYNALAAIALGRQLEIDEEVIKKTLKEFTGTWRRFEILGEYKKALVVSDYAHHPVAVAATIRAAKEAYPDKRVVAVFQPHQRARTKALFEEFTQAFSEADYLILQEIYDVAGREEAEYADISSKKLVDALEEQGQYPVYTPDAEATRVVIDDILEKDDLLLIMGAGDIYLLAEELVAE